MAHCRRLIVTGIVGALFFTLACGGGGNLDFPEYGATGVTPVVGNYPIRGDDGSIIAVLQVEEENGELAMRYIRYPELIDNGAFEVSWGQIGGTHCPTDGFFLRGHFLSPTTVEGVLAFEFACRITDVTYFSTELAQ